jgi:hypothetical protein
VERDDMLCSLYEDVYMGKKKKKLCYSVVAI